MRKVLLVHYFYKPFSSNQSFRYESIIESGYFKDIQIDILTSKHKGLHEVEYTSHGNIYRVNSKFLSKDINKTVSAEKIETEGKNTTNKLVNVLKKILYQIIWPDFAGLWILPAIKKGRKLAEFEKYDQIISGSFPFSSHVVGFFIKRKFKNINWVVDYLDPFSLLKDNENPSNNTKIYKNINYFIEREINKNADKIILLKEAYSTFSDQFPELLHKTVVAPPMLGINLETFYNTEEYQFEKKGINIVFIGSLYKSIRNPEPILKIFEKFSAIDKAVYVHFVGDLKDCSEIIEKYKQDNKINIVTHGLVSREKAISFMKGADVLLNISNTSEVQLPGKVVEYAFSRKRIINYSLIENNNTTKFFDDLKILDRVFNIVGKQCDIDNLYNFISNNVEGKEIDISGYLPENIGKLYFD